MKVSEVWNAVRGGEPKWEECSRTHKETFAYLVESVAKTGVAGTEMERQIHACISGAVMEGSDESVSTAEHADELAHEEVVPVKKAVKKEKK